MYTRCTYDVPLTRAPQVQLSQVVELRALPAAAGTRRFRVRVPGQTHCQSCSRRSTGAVHVACDRRDGKGLGFRAL